MNVIPIIRTTHTYTQARQIPIHKNELRVRTASKKCKNGACLIGLGTTQLAYLEFLVDLLTVAIEHGKIEGSKVVVETVKSEGRREREEGG